MKEKIKTILIVIIIIAYAVLWYPWFVSVEDGKTRCHNLLGFTMSCR